MNIRTNSVTGTDAQRQSEHGGAQHRGGAPSQGDARRFFLPSGPGGLRPVGASSTDDEAHRMGLAGGQGRTGGDLLDSRNALRAVCIGVPVALFVLWLIGGF